MNTIANSGFVNSLAQTLLKITLPGVPDFYQGSELWDFNLVDPDNRRPIDFDARRDQLDRLIRGADRDVLKTARELADRWPDPDVKLWVTMRSLALRRDWPEVFSFGDYIPLSAVGAAESHVLSFTRKLDRRFAVTVVPRHFFRLNSAPSKPTRSAPRADWHGTKLLLPETESGVWTCELSGRTFESRAEAGNSVLDVGPLFEVLPVALLTSEAQ